MYRDLDYRATLRQLSFNFLLNFLGEVLRGDRIVNTPYKVRLQTGEFNFY